MSTKSPSYRRDGRGPNELRPIKIHYTGLDRVDGSARFSFGVTSSLASVSGPIEVRPQSELASESTFDVALRPLSNVPGTESKSLAATLRALLVPSLVLTQNPRTLIQLTVQSLTPSTRPGAFHFALVSSFVNASTLALVNAGSVSMRGVVLAVAVGRLRSDSSPALVLDPSEVEEASLEAGGCFAFLFGSRAQGADSSADSSEVPCESVWSNYRAIGSGSVHAAPTLSELEAATKLAQAGAKKIWEEVRNSLGSMDGPRSLPQWDPGPRARRMEGVASGVGGGGEMEDEMEEADELDDAKMEI